MKSDRDAGEAPCMKAEPGVNGSENRRRAFDLAGKAWLAGKACLAQKPVLCKSPSIHPGSVRGLPAVCEATRICTRPSLPAEPDPVWVGSWIRWRSALRITAPFVTSGCRNAYLLYLIDGFSVGANMEEAVFVQGSNTSEKPPRTVAFPLECAAATWRA